MFLDELPPDAGRHEPPISDDCGIMCELQAMKMPNTKLSGGGTADKRQQTEQAARRMTYMVRIMKHINHS
jgi:hypothetical protein